MGHSPQSSTLLAMAGIARSHRSSNQPTPTHQPGIDVIGCGEAWVEDHAHFIRSTEFDLLAEGDSFDEALGVFIAQSFEYLALLADLVGEQRATEDEHRLFDA